MIILTVAYVFGPPIRGYFLREIILRRLTLFAVAFSLLFARRVCIIGKPF